MSLRLGLRGSRGQRVLPRLKYFQEIQGMQATAGFYARSKYSDGTPIPFIMRIQEFGRVDERIPARPFMRYTAKTHRKKWKKMISVGLQRRQDQTQILSQVGDVMRGDIQDTITRSDSLFEPNAPSTIKAKGGNNSPLKDTATALRAISFEVRKTGTRRKS